MPNTFEVNSTLGAYSVTVGRNLIASTIERFPNAVYIVDSNLIGSIPAGVKLLIAIEAREKNKSLSYLPTVIAELRKIDATRDTHIVAIGGGIVQDIATFAASIYMRGVHWTYVATTMLSMVDSCIGGKSSINVGDFKNLVGNFYPPKDVIVDTDYIRTLNNEMVVGGLCEAAKICFARGYPQFQHYLTLMPGYPLNSELAINVILYSLKTKKWFIEVDEFDQKERLLLNFGHTFGHAIEGGTNFGISHGIGVGLGMLAACHFARQTKKLTKLGQGIVQHLEDHVFSILMTTQGPVISKPPFINLNVILEKFKYDKKHRQNMYCLVLPQGDGALELISIPRNAITRDAVRSAYAAVFAKLGWTDHQTRIDFQTCAPLAIGQ